MVQRGGGKAVGLSEGFVWPGLVLAGGRLVWAESDTTSILELEPTSGKVRVLAARTNMCSSLVIDDEKIYYTVNDSERSPTLYSIPRGGGKPSKLATGAGCVLAGDAVTLYTGWHDGIRARRKRGGAWRTLGEGIRGVRAIAVDNDALYVSAWVDAEPGRIVKVPLAGGAPSDVVTGQRRPGKIAVGATHVCWTTENGANDGAILCSRKSGGAAITVDEHQSGARWLAMSGDYVYWVVHNTKRSGTAVRRSRLAP